MVQILGHCHPKDLISLSRTNRQFRNILLANSAVWRRARERLDGPDCPSYTSEREWAILLFVKVCEVRFYHIPGLVVLKFLSECRFVEQMILESSIFILGAVFAFHAKRKSKSITQVSEHGLMASFGSLISTSQFHEHFPGISEATMDIVPYTNDLYRAFCEIIEPLSSWLNMSVFSIV